MDYYEIGQRVRNLRKARSLSQEQLAEKVGISTTHMSHIETGSTKLSLPVLANMAKALDTSCDELLFGHEPSTDRSIEKIAQLLKSCTPGEAQALTAILQSAKQAMDDYLLK